MSESGEDRARLVSKVEDSDVECLVDSDDLFTVKYLGKSVEGRNDIVLATQFSSHGRLLTYLKIDKEESPHEGDRQISFSDLPSQAQLIVARDLNPSRRLHDDTIYDHELDAEIDRGVHGLVKFFIINGLKTKFSCEGHPKSETRHFESPAYVSVDGIVPVDHPVRVAVRRVFLPGLYEGKFDPATTTRVISAGGVCVEEWYSRDRESTVFRFSPAVGTASQIESRL